MIKFSLPRILILFPLIISLTVFPSAPLHYASLKVPLVRGAIAPHENWYPAGSSMDYLDIHIYGTEGAEGTSFINGFLHGDSNGVDFLDAPLQPSDITNFLPDSRVYVTSSAAQGTLAGLDFNLANNFWGCDFGFGSGSGTCGPHVRAAIAHLIDKNIFASGLSYPGTSVDNPTGNALPATPNPCTWDPLFPGNNNCQIGAPGGTAFHLATATGRIYPWQPDFGSQDFCAAATHLITAYPAIATRMDPTTCVLKNLQSSVYANPVHIFIRDDNPDLQSLGYGIAQEICALFTGSFVTGCSNSSGQILIVDHGTFSGFESQSTGVNKTWWIYTSGAGTYASPSPFESSDYTGGEGQYGALLNLENHFLGDLANPSPNTTCGSPSKVSSSNPSNYVYLCNPQYDNLANLARTAPCTSAPGDPAVGQTTTPSPSYCQGSNNYSLSYEGYLADDMFGRNAWDLPVYVTTPQFAYLSNWQRAINSWGGTFNYFTWLNTLSPTPLVYDTIRQGFAQPTGTLNPFRASSSQEISILHSIYDSLSIINPANHNQIIDWMTATGIGVVPIQTLSYTPPPGTVGAFRVTLRNDIFWQTGQKLTAWDVAFSYIAFKHTGVLAGARLDSMTGIKVLSPTQLDIDVSELDLFSHNDVTSPIIIPGRDWVDNSKCTASAWDSAANNQNWGQANSALTACIAPSNAVTSAGVITPVGSNVDMGKVTSYYDPITNGILVGSGPWGCRSNGAFGTGCSGVLNDSHPAPGETFYLTRFGQGIPPGGGLTNTYFRSSGNLALWVWSGDRGVFSKDFLNFGQVSNCYGQPLGTQGCTQWQQGIGATNGYSVVGLSQVSIVQRLVGVSWIPPYDWMGNSPDGIASFAPTLYDGLAQLKPASVAGCLPNYYPTAGYDC